MVTGCPSFLVFLHCWMTNEGWQCVSNSLFHSSTHPTHSTPRAHSLCHLFTSPFHQCKHRFPVHSIQQRSNCCSHSLQSALCSSVLFSVLGACWLVRSLTFSLLSPISLSYAAASVSLTYLWQPSSSNSHCAPTFRSPAVTVALAPSPMCVSIPWTQWTLGNACGAQ